MAIGWEALTIDAEDPESLARWWAQTLNWDLMDSSPAGVEVRPSDGHGPSLFFAHVPQQPRTKNPLHLDLYATDQAAAVVDLISRGAIRADVGQPEDAEWVVMHDPEGNEFCLLEPR